MINRIIHKTINILFCICFIWIAIVVFFFNNLPIPDWVRKEFLLSNFVLLVIGLVYAWLVAVITDKIRLNVPLVTLIVYLMLCLGTYFCYFKTGWDAGQVTDKAWNAALNGILDVPEWYYSFYTNNILIHCYEYGIFKLCISFGITELEHAMYVLVLINCLVSAISSLLVYDALMMLYPTSRRAASLGYVFYLGLIMLSPWVLVAYTDSLALILPILIVWLYLKVKNNVKNPVFKALFGGLICFWGFFAYKLKATAGIVLIAVILTEIISTLRNFRDAKFKNSLRLAVSLVLLIVMYYFSNLIYTSTYTACGVVLDKELACPVTHYLKMGFNDSEAGTFNYPDSDETAYISLYKDRYENDLSKAKSRIKALLPFGIFRFEARKTLVNYHDGTFANGVEGGFYATVYPDRDKVVSPLLKNIFWTDGIFYPYLECILQGLWLTVLVLGIVFGGSHDKDGEILIKLILIGIFMFLSLFESRARYLYIFSPLFIVAFAGGCERIISKWRKHFG